jgi:cysteine desulfurase
MIYLDNAATTPLDSEVIAAMADVMKNHYGNPSSIHTYGREARVLIEDSRKMIASLLKVAPSNIFFTSCATEGINMVLNSYAEDLGVSHIITSPVEHHAVLHTIEHLVAEKKCDVSYLNLDKKGNIDIDNLESLLKQKNHSLVCLMHANNEIGNMLPLTDVSKLCLANNALFLCDTVQTMGKYGIDLGNISIHFAFCSAHKLHGPKGAGFLYLQDVDKIHPMILGGGQERNIRSGTENIYGIVGLAKAFEVAYRDLEKNMKHIQTMKSRMVQMLKENIFNVAFNGESEENGLYTILNVSFPKTQKSDALLYSLDIEGIAASGGSACTSGAVNASHVLKAIGAGKDRVAIRFSFSKFNTLDEIDTTIEVLKRIL